jgi:bacterioferritin
MRSLHTPRHSSFLESQDGLYADEWDWGSQRRGVCRYYEDLVQGLQEDLAREYKAIIQYVIYSQKLDHAQFMDIATELEKHARQELDHALRIAKQLDYFGAYPTHEPKPVEVSEDSEQMLWFDLRAEDETVRNYRERIRQAESLGEYGLAEELREIIRNEQEHQLDLATALGVIADPDKRQTNT